MAAAHSGPLQLYVAQTNAIGLGFENHSQGVATVSQLAEAAGRLAIALFDNLEGAGLGAAKDFCLVALGGLGRGVLFPYSDIDLLFLCADRRVEERHQEHIAELCRTMWDLQLRVSPTTRTLDECSHLHRDNLEFNIALLDSRFLTGDATLFARLHDQIIPQLVARERSELVQNLSDMTRQRHQRNGNTIFHLEPSIKDVPGGLRDYNVSYWLALIQSLTQSRDWPPAESLLLTQIGPEPGRAFEFFAATRCFLHYRHGRDNNLLTYELQDEAAALSIGAGAEERLETADWMRNYFRHARCIQRMTTHFLEDMPPARSSLYSLYEGWRSRLSNAEFSVVRGRIYLRQPAALNSAAAVLDLFEFVARHGLPISREAETQSASALAQSHGSWTQFPGLWLQFCRILVLPFAAQALRGMHEAGLLSAFFPEFEAIDSLVIRDFYHRYTVDEHSLMAIDNLARLHQPETDVERRYQEILSALQQPELLFFALLFHDVGKGMATGDHVQGSVQALQAAMARMNVDGPEREAVRFLIASHLEMSSTLLRRDIFDPETVREFARKVGSQQSLKMLTLLTYADFKSVNPEALTPWKAETLWQLYAATTNHLNRSLDDDRLSKDSFPPEQAATALGLLNEVLALLDTAADAAALRKFLAGLPARYLKMHSPAEIAQHYVMAQWMETGSASVKVVKVRDLYRLTVVTADRPQLFAAIAGAIAAWGMNIVKANAFSNSAGVVLDTFHFSDRFNTLDLNPSERTRFEHSLIEVIEGSASLATLMASRPAGNPAARQKVKVQTRIWMDNELSSHSTLLEVVAQDRPGLLHDLNSAISQAGCNIEVALIDTEGQSAIDVFYLTSEGEKLLAEKQDELQQALVLAAETGQKKV